MKVIAEKVNATVWYVVCIVLFLFLDVVSIWALCTSNKIGFMTWVEVVFSFGATVAVIVCWLVDGKKPKVLISLDNDNNLVLFDGQIISLLRIFNVYAEVYRSRYGDVSRNGDVVFQVSSVPYKYNLITCDEIPDQEVVTEDIQVSSVKNCNDVVRTIIRLVSELRADTDPNELYDLYDGTDIK